MDSKVKTKPFRSVEVRYFIAKITVVETEFVKNKVDIYPRSLLQIYITGPPQY